MFGNFIYLIIVLLIYSSYYPPEQPNFQGMYSALLALALAFVFAAVNWIQFRRIEQRIGSSNFLAVDNRFSSVLNRHSILAILLFTFDIYGINLTMYTSRLPLVSTFPTLEAVICLTIYLLYMTIVWTFAWFPYHKLYQADISLKSYVSSQISFSIPVVLPWLFISCATDMLQVLPFELPKKIAASPSGQLVYFLVFLFVTACIGPAMIQKFWRCRPLEPGYIRSRIEALCLRSGFKFANIVYWPIFGGRMITAGVMGLVKRFRYLMVTEALLQFLNPDEIDAVIAHEIGHVRKKHLFFYLFFFAGYMVISYSLYDILIMVILYVPQLYQMMGQILARQSSSTSALLTTGTILSFLIYFRYIFGYFMRNFERQADAFVFTLFSSSLPLISTLEKIALSSGQSSDKPNWHHFSISERIGFLKKCEIDRTWVIRHDNKIRKSIAVYLIVLVLAGIVGYTLHWGETGKKLNAELFEKILLQEIENDRSNPVPFNILGDFYVSRNRPDRAKQAYEQVLTLQPDNFSALNNLAWLLVTSKDEAFRDPRRAVTLARKAAALKASPQILDTLAESLYATGQYEEAEKAGEQALQLAVDNRDYFEAQLKKFRMAAAQ